MRKYEISPAIAAAMRNRAMATSYQQTGVPLYLELPRYEPMIAPAYVEFDAEDSRIEADSFTLGDDDDFY